MKEKTKLILGGIWVSVLTLISVALLSLFKNAEQYQLVILVWAFAWLGGLQFKSWFVWMQEYRDKNPKVIV